MPIEPDAETLAVAEMRDNLPEIDVRPDTALRRLLIRPFAVIAQPLVRELTDIRDQLSLSNAAELTEDSLDALAANVFAFRREGQSAQGTVRLFFVQAVTVSIEVSVVFRSDSGTGFNPIVRRDFTATQMRVNADGDRFYVDVACVAQNPGESGNVLRGTIVTMDNGPNEVAEVSNPGPFTGGLDRETNAQFAARLPEAISLRALVNKPGISQVILDAFEQVTALQSIGFGDPEMERDLLTGSDLSLGGQPFDDANGVHIGGMTDIYIRTLSAVNGTATLISANGDVKPHVVFGRPAANDEEVSPEFAAPILAIETIELADPATGVCLGVFLEEGVDYVVVQEQPELTFSATGVTRIDFLETSLLYPVIFEGDGRSLIITYLTNPDVIAVQEFVDDPANRPVCANLLVKAFVPVFMDVAVTYFPTPIEELAVGSTFASEDVVISAITNFLNRVENSSGFNIDDLYRVLYALEIERVNKPILVQTETLLADGSSTTEPLAGGEDDTEFEILDRGTLDSVEASIKVPLPDRDLGRIGVSLGDQMTFTWDGMEEEIEVAGVERATPADTVLTVVRLEEQAPEASNVTYEIRRDTIKNVANVERTSTITPRSIRVFRLPI